MIFLSLFITFFKIGLFGFGGGYGMLSLIQHETVESHHWLSTAEQDVHEVHEDSSDTVDICGSAPCRRRSVGCCHPVALQRRELLHPEGEPLAVLYQLCPAHRNGCRHRLSEDQSHPHDLLCRYCGLVITILKTFRYETINHPTLRHSALFNSSLCR